MRQGDVHAQPKKAGCGAVGLSLGFIMWQEVLLLVFSTATSATGTSVMPSPGGLVKCCMSAH